MAIHDLFRPWEVRPFELIYHAELHYRKKTDYDRRLALISFDNSIEVSITRYLSLHPSQRGDREYEKQDVSQWNNNYHTKIDFFISENNRRGLPQYKEKEDIIWYHEQRNECYHGDTVGVPEISTLKEIRKIALWVFSILYEHPDIETELETIVLDMEKERPLIPDSYVVPENPEINISKNSTAQNQSLTYASLIGSWNENNEEDLKLIGDLVKDFDSWIADLREIVQEEDNPFNLQNGHWEVKNRIEVWYEIGSRVFDTDLDRFKDCAIKVLSEVDPQFDLPPEKRYAASIHNKELIYSKELRKGIVETLALLGTHGDSLKHCSNNKPKSVAGGTIRNIFDQSDWQHWASLKKLLPILAESAPTIFLDLVEDALQKKPCPFDELFIQERGGITGRNYMSGLLWALENVSWIEKHFVRVLLILAELAKRDPGGSWANRPINSIITILLPWFPQTKVSIDKRFTSIRAIKKDFPDIAWELLLNLLPSQHQTSSGIHKPKWLNVVTKDWKPKVTKGEYWKQIIEYANIAIDIANKDLSKLNRLVSNLDNLPKPAFKRILKHLSSEYIKNLEEDKRLLIWNKLEDFITKHKKYSDADWALSKKYISKIEDTANTLRPSKPEYLYQRLFTDQDSKLYEKNENWEQQRKQLNNKRKKAINKIYDNSGLDGVIDFVKKVESPHQVGIAFGLIIEDYIDNNFVKKYLESQEKCFEQFINGFIWSHFRKNGWGWIDNIDRTNWSNAEVCQLLLFLPFEMKTWKRVEEWLNDSTESYWGKVNANPYQCKSDLLYAIDNFLKYSRPHQAIDCLYYRLENKSIVDTERIVKALLGFPNNPENIKSNDHYKITELIKAIQQAEDIDQNDLFKVEWVYIQLFDSYSNIRPKLLEKKLATEPEFFCEIIQMLYKPKGAENSKEIQNKSQEFMISNAWRLLYIWKRPPGLHDDGSFSPKELKEWLKKVKQFCRKSGHLEVAMNKVGEVLLYCPPDMEGLWIDREVASILNERDADKMRRGFSTKIYNSRGAHWVDPSGKDERKLADEWREKANNLEEEGFARLASTLRELADSYDREAERIVIRHEGKDVKKKESE